MGTCTMLNLNGWTNFSFLHHLSKKFQLFDLAKVAIIYKKI
jgi:hypothetical protein